jgi:hypothetical protein
VLTVVFAVSAFLVKMGIMRKISKIEKIKNFTIRIEIFTPVTARKVALKREGKKLVRVVNMRMAV